MTSTYLWNQMKEGGAAEGANGESDHASHRDCIEGLFHEWEEKYAHDRGEADDGHEEEAISPGWMWKQERVTFIAFACCM